MSGTGAIPRRLGKYEIRGTLGAGAMGMVYDGWDPTIGRRVAIKTARLDNIREDDTDDGVARFRREAQAAGRLQHPNIVGVFDFAETDTVAYIVMEFVPGGSLKEVLDKKGPVPVARACRIMTEILSALAFSHKNNIVHRDIKPANIMLTAEGSVKLADFGIAKTQSSTTTSFGTMLGTPAYMAPEQFLFEEADARSDIYAAGATFFHLLTGTRPYEGSLNSIRHQVLTGEEPPAASERAPGVPVALDSVILKAMARKREDRFQDANQFAIALLKALTAPTLAPQPHADPPTPLDEAEETIRLAAGSMAAGVPSSAASALSGAESLLPPGLLDTPQPTADPLEPTAKPVEAAAPRAPIIAPAKQKSATGAIIAGIAAAVLLIGGAAAYFMTRTGAPSVPARPVPAPGGDAVQTSPPQPTQAVTPPPDSAAVAAAVNQALAQAHCALTQAAPSGNGLTVTGTAGAGANNDHARALAAAAASGLPITWNVRTFTAPFCDTLDTIHAAYAAGQLSFTTADGKTALRDGDLIKMAIGGMDFPAWVRVESLDSSGSNYHLYPTTKDSKAGVRAAPASLLAAGATLHLGEAGQNRWQASPPYGDALLVAVASSEQLLPQPRRNGETMDKYLADLRAAIAAAKGRGARLAANVLLLELSGK